MRVVGDRTELGVRYRIYRADSRFCKELAQVIPFARRHGCALSIGEDRDDPDLVVTVGPLDAVLDRLFREQLALVLWDRIAVGAGAVDWRLSDWR